ncbi:MAG: DegT/DnrJ/EryC1/StrS family aminotransferase [Methanomassiliicoccales archaeon]|nr:DegT/DnrJ/EryC1/StrS family aminotransferase [Methanomassiliicoccales archaeon]
MQKRWVGVGDFKITDIERKAINDVLDSGKITEGKKTHQFERKWADFVGTSKCVAVNSGTSALIVGMMALTELRKWPKRKTAITTPLTYVATSNSLVLTGFNPIYVDVDEKTFGITPDGIKEAIEGVKVDMPELILPVHLMGYPCDMGGISRICHDNGIALMEDSSQAHGTVVEGKRTGSMSDLSTFSFYIAHNIQAGELGAVCTDDPGIEKLMRSLKANGRRCDCVSCTRRDKGCVRRNDVDTRDPRFTHERIGYNFKTMEFQTSLASVQIDKVSEIIKTRSDNVRYLNDQLSMFADKIKLPDFDPNVSYLAYPMIVDESIDRDSLVKKLENRGVEARPLFGCIPTQQPSYLRYKKRYQGKLKVAERLGAHGMYVGCHQYLTHDDLDYIAQVFKEVLT